MNSTMKLIELIYTSTIFVHILYLKAIRDPNDFK